MSLSIKTTQWKSAIISTAAATLLFTLSTSSLALSSDVKSQLLKASNNKASGSYVRSRFLARANTPFDNKNTHKKALIIGDSHAQDFFNSVLESHSLTNYQIRTRSIPTGCQPFIGAGVEKNILPKDQAICKKADNLTSALEQISQADLVILVANWKEWSARQLPQTIKHLKLKPEQKLVVVGRKSLGKISVRRYLRMSEKELLALRNKPDAKQEEINNLMKNNLDKDVFIDLQQIICDSGTSCAVFTKDLNLISFDGGHLTAEGAEYIGKKLFKSTILSGL